MLTVAFVRTDISEEHVTSIRVKRISEPGTMSVLTRATWLHIPEDRILHSHRHENLKSYLTVDVH
jgi:hypothetical protein